MNMLTMRRFLCMCILGSFMTFTASGQLSSDPQPLSYFLPDGDYNPDIPTPKEVLGYEVGEWHVSHDQLLYYMRTLAQNSDRIHLEEIGRTYENRPLIHLIFTSPQNHQNRESIRTEHLQLSQPGLGTSLDLDNMPGVVWMGYSIHGNEASGSNAALAAAYYLAASEDAEVRTLLDEMVILFDPSYNPDGLQRFSTWVNSHRGINVLLTNGDSREHNEAWPGGRTNHFWFDLNRDWLPVQHPESQARIRQFHKWKPNFLTDHHEMGTNSTFFFQPGIPSRNHPFTPEKVFELTHKMARYHADELDQIGSLYFSEEGFDDFYYGKGSTYPDINGGVGILFEQASARGHAQDSDNGVLTLAFAARNHFATTLSTLKGTHALRKELLEHQQTFFRTAIQEARQHSTKAFILSSENDPMRLHAFNQMLSLHDIQTFGVEEGATHDGVALAPQATLVVPLEQPQHRLIRAIFEKMTSFQDSLFYDVSAWTLPLAFDLDYVEIDNISQSFRDKLTSNPFPRSPQGKIGPEASYAYAFEWQGYFAPRALYKLQSKGVRVKVATQPFTAHTKQDFTYGTILVPMQNQPVEESEIRSLMEELAQEEGIDIHSLETGLTPAGPDLGSRTIETLEMPKVLMLIGRGASSYDAGEVWHLLDQRYHMPVTMAEINPFNSINLEDYNTLILVNGSYPLNEAQVESLAEWIREGGTVIAMKRALNWLNGKKLLNLTYQSREPQTGLPAGSFPPPFDNRANVRGAQVIGGAIFETRIDLTHPLGYGFTDSFVPVFRNTTIFIKPANNGYGQPIRYTDTPLLSGYISPPNLDLLRNSAACHIEYKGRGRIIAFTDDPNFRAFWYGSNKLFANALFFRDQM